MVHSWYSINVCISVRRKQELEAEPTLRRLVYTCCSIDVSTNGKETQ